MLTKPCVTSATVNHPRKLTTVRPGDVIATGSPSCPRLVVDRICPQYGHGSISQSGLQPSNAAVAVVAPWPNCTSPSPQTGGWH